MSDRRDPFGSAHYDWFWSVIDRIRAAPASAEALFQSMSVEELEGFYNIYRAVSVELYPEYDDEEKGWYEEGISRASDWVVNQGKEFYHAVYNDLSRFPDPQNVPYCALSGWAAGEYYRRTGREFTH
jgi:hypothetical protein